jgi:regulatory protein
MKRPAASLEARATAWLAQREQSRSELRRKLLRVALADSGDEDAAAAAERVERLLERLQHAGLLSEARFVDSRVRTRKARSGLRRIEHELAQHGLKIDAAQRQRLHASELQRARELWQRRFDGPSADPRERSRQMRYLAGRGFAADVVRQVVRGAAGLPEDDDCG